MICKEILFCMEGTSIFTGVLNYALAKGRNAFLTNQDLAGRKLNPGIP